MGKFILDQTNFSFASTDFNDDTPLAIIVEAVTNDDFTILFNDFLYL
jgi:hypothetical protein